MSLDRRTLLVSGGVGLGLVVGWRLWPRRHAANLQAGPGETVFGAWLKVGEDGHITVAVPQVEYGQGVYTALPQIVADALGADWRTVGVEAAPLNPLYGNPIGLVELTGASPARGSEAPRLTGGSSSVRRFEEDCARAGASARVLLQKAAARRWDADWRELAVDAGFVTWGRQRLRFAELAATAAGEDLPDPLPLAGPGTGRLVGKPLPRLDAPAKVDGSANYAGDVRLPDMVHAAVRAGPIGDSRLLRVDKPAADRVRGVLHVVETPRWAAAVATTGWAAERAVQALAPRFETRGPEIDDAAVARALGAALKAEGRRVTTIGEPEPLLAGSGLITARYEIAAGPAAPIEPPSAAAHFRDGRLELWAATQAPGLARAAAARAAGLGEDAVVVHPMLIGGSFGQALDTRVVEQAAVLATRLKRPVSLTWSRAEALRQAQVRPPCAAILSARLAAGGGIAAWRAQIAAPAIGRALRDRLAPGGLAWPGGDDPLAVAGAETPYRLPALAVEWHAAEVALPLGHVRGGMHLHSCFVTESFLDEVVRAAGQEPVSYRIGMLGGDPRLARCLSTAASLAGWDGGAAGSGQGVACWRMRGSAIAVVAEARLEAGAPKVERLVAAVDCGRAINPDLMRQQIEGGLLFGVASAVGAATGYARNLPTANDLGDLRLPRLADAPDITVELIASDEAPGGVSELAVPPVAPALANALASATGRRYRSLPLA
jgi:isoquinoline 1-oxidoreductase subunit beta